MSLFDLVIGPRAWVELRPSGALWILPRRMVREMQLNDEASYCD